MIKHIVLFKLKPEADGRSREENMRFIVEKLQALPSKIDVIREYEVGPTIITGEVKFDLALYSSFESLADLTIYREHQEHKKVVDLINIIAEDRAAVDYEV